MIRLSKKVIERFINLFNVTIDMPHHISYLEYGLVDWSREDQPVTRHVRILMETDGLIKEMIAKLENGQDGSVREVRQYPNLSGSNQDYFCLVSRYPTQHPDDPKYVVHIKPNRATPWDAIGEVYVGDARKRMEEILKED